MKLSTATNMWNTLVRERRQDFIGGEIEHIETPEGAYRGPIKTIGIKNNKVIVTTEWTAHMPTNQHGMPLRAYWERLTRKDAEVFTYDLGEVEGIGLITGAPSDIGGGRVHFHAVVGLARVTLFPKGTSKLDRSKVRGL